jgi:hypothetical protein
MCQRCGVHVRGEKYIQDDGERRDHYLKCLGVNMKVIINWILNEWYARE